MGPAALNPTALEKRLLEMGYGLLGSANKTAHIKQTHTNYSPVDHTTAKKAVVPKLPFTCVSGAAVTAATVKNTP